MRGNDAGTMWLDGHKKSYRNQPALRSFFWTAKSDKPQAMGPSLQLFRHSIVVDWNLATVWEVLIPYSQNEVLVFEELSCLKFAI
jgi:hypothetical protein